MPAPKAHVLPAMHCQGASVAGSSRLGVHKEGLHEVRLSAGVRRCRQGRRRTVTVPRAEGRKSRTEQYREERVWRSELEPRQPAARPPEGLNVVSVLSSVELDLDTSDTLLRERKDWGPFNPVAQRWEELPSRWKMIAATSLAFVICNMVLFQTIQ